MQELTQQSGYRKHNSALAEHGAAGSAVAAARAEKLTVRVRITNDASKPFEREEKGRAAWMLLELVAAGDRGVTSIENPAPRIAHYVWLLRGDGIRIETITEAHGGPFAGSHARYVLRSKVEILEQSGGGERRAA